MKSLSRRVVVGLAATVVSAIGACQWLWPERLAVNAPLRQLILGRGITAPSGDLLAERLRIGYGLQVGRWAEGVEGARMMRWTAAGHLLVSQPRLGRVALLEPDRNGDGRSDGARVLVGELDRPHGIDLRDGWLYIGETGAIARVRFDPETATTSGAVERIVAGLPEGGNHWTRTLRFGPDGWMYVHVGSSCNVCIESDERRATMMRFRADGSDGEVFARGLRNSVGFDWHPLTGELYATDNGRDLLGDDFPPCELNRVIRGGFYGWPFANGDRVSDPDFGAGHEAEITASISPVHGFRAHNAPLGITFVRSASAPAPLKGAALVALHGSWNRTRKDGYRVVSLHWTDDGSIIERDFLTGFERDGDVVGRPVDVSEGPDGAFYVSDDYAGSILRISRDAPRATAARTPSVPERSADDVTARRWDEAAERGRALWERHGCATCHNAERAAPGVVPKLLTGLALRYSRADLAALLRTPTPPMPVLPLGEEERADLAVHLLRAHP